MKLRTLFESVRGPNQYFAVMAERLPVWRGIPTTQPNTFPSVEPFTLNSGDELHWLHGGLFAVHNGHVVAGIHLDDPSKRNQADFYAYKHNPTGYIARELDILWDSGDIERISKDEAAKVKYVG